MDRICSRCRQNKSLDCFHKDSRMPGGHRYVCKGCRSEERKQKYWSNPDHFRTKALEGYYKNLDNNRSLARARRTVDRQTLQYRSYMNNYLSERRAKMKADDETKRFITEHLDDPCVYCGQPGGTIDHIIPVSRGGLHHWTNMAPACIDCNRKKQARTPEEWKSNGQL